jgi:hypothetical protein
MHASEPPGDDVSPAQIGPDLDSTHPAGDVRPTGMALRRLFRLRRIAMVNDETTKYFDLYTTGIGYLNRVREVTPKEGSPFWTVTIAALRGSVDDAQYTRFECRVSGKQAREVVRQVKPAIEGKLKVLVGFTLSDLSAESFTFKNGDKAGETGVSLKARLLRVSWAKVDGQPFYHEQAA